MKLNAQKAWEILSDKGVEYLYHANSVMTACTYLSESALLSRGYVESHGLHQTPQSSDSIDKKYRIWNDVFLDTIDIHHRASRRNYYGPVLFVLDLDVLLHDPISTIWITRKNPTNWVPGETRSERYVSSIKKLRETFDPSDFGSMIVLREINGRLPFAGCLRRLIVDDPGELMLAGEKRRVFKPAITALRNAAHDGGIKYLRIATRVCSRFCDCGEQYYTYPYDTISMFKPTGN